MKAMRTGNGKDMPTNGMLWYDAPATCWDEALPLGNGHLGAMVFGRVDGEHIALNDDTLWSGGPQDRDNPDALAYLPTIRSLIFAGQIQQAESLAYCALSGTPEQQRVYQPLGDLHIVHAAPPDREAVADYRRALSLDTAEITVGYAADGTRYTRRVYISAPDDVLIVHLEAVGDATLDFRCNLTRSRFTNDSRAEGGDTLSIGGRMENDGVAFCCMLRAVCDGEMETIGDHLLVHGARQATLYLAAYTTFRRPDPHAACVATLEGAVRKGEAAVRADHLCEYQSYFQRVRFSLGAEGAAALSTDRRLKAVGVGARDPALAALYFQYGRYLLIASSRPGTLPATLQGIWNGRLTPPWDSKYTININIQMNYWPAETCALPEMHGPLFDHLRRMLPNGRRTARKMYGCRGFCAHHNTDLWGDCAPQDRYIPASYWPMGAAWLCLHIRTHYEYTGDTAFLRAHFDLLEEACLFFVDYLVEDATGRMVTCPSVSPENTYVLPDGTRGCLCYGASMDNQILHQLFSDYLAACDVLAVEGAYVQEVRALLGKLPKPMSGRHGQLMEWPEDYFEAEPGHRHISHLFGLYPGTRFAAAPAALRDACRETLRRRLAHGGGHTGWSRAWIIGLWAHLGEGALAEENLRALFAGSTFANLLDNHPLGDGFTFQLDGNMGATAAIAEMLLQSDPQSIRLLPALPAAWPEGSIEGLRARGGLEVSIRWTRGALASCTLVADADREITVRYGDRSQVLSLQASVPYTLDAV